MRRLAIILWATQLLAATAMLVAAAIHIHSIIVTGPILAVVGLLVALVTCQLRSWSTLAFAVSGPLVSALISFLIAAFKLGPDQARTPTLVILSTYMAVVLPVAVIACHRIYRWDTTAIDSPRPVVQFSLKTLLILMTATAIVIGAGKLLFNARIGEGFMFGGFTFVVVALVGLVTWRCLAYQPAGP